ncbi:hypothetical protein FJ414_26670 [Mesorhizobium sp. B3-1-6]|uniref:hypothetical protein n=1 Tax=Mesorhizobium sp. B3-1-6 TaxID=2589895 RepID=UPI001129D2FD|nr:hypothetical protein [Mesorhizobium sp. B3-1-6]TPI29003.1 hypothetical protein FJ414_26670 [Mesorhizobium sp. B3-1-6]
MVIKVDHKPTAAKGFKSVPRRRSVAQAVAEYERGTVHLSFWTGQDVGRGEWQVSIRAVDFKEVVTAMMRANQPAALRAFRAALQSAESGATQP